MLAFPPFPIPPHKAILNVSVPSAAFAQIPQLPITGPNLLPVPTASLRPLRQVYTHEMGSSLPLKLAPPLTQKSLYPSSTERQNVRLMLKVFDNRNIFALKSYQDTLGFSSEGTQTFILWAYRLWQIFNCNHPTKHIRFREDFFKPISSVKDKSFAFLLNILLWLNNWKLMNLKSKEGVLSNDTMLALTHTLLSLF